MNFASLGLALLVCAGQVSGIFSAPNAKRGFVADGCTGTTCTDATLLSSAGWYYDYNVADPYGSEGAGESVRFAPMHWCLSSLNATIPSYVNLTYMLGFNEPNNIHNCNTDAKTVAQAWGQVMKMWPGSLLVSPATAGNGVPWFDDFFAECKTLYGKSGCNISYLAAHDYSCDPQTTMSYLETLHSRYGYPVWLTEFSCGDGAQGNPTKDHLAFMKVIVPLLDAAPYVYRYAWMSARDKAGLRGLVEVDGSGNAALTSVGQLYNSL